mmetsp:Transcript_8320/g.15760  ORF Transcript_8320/g.15760 Transcript_8320/m.15760 type:complete len:260 (+) Transcript_8320:1611-2390(+)
MRRRRRTPPPSLSSRRETKSPTPRLQWRAAARLQHRLARRETPARFPPWRSTRTRAATRAACQATWLCSLTMEWRPTPKAGSLPRVPSLRLRLRRLHHLSGSRPRTTSGCLGRLRQGQAAGRRTPGRRAPRPCRASRWAPAATTAPNSGLRRTPRATPPTCWPRTGRRGRRARTLCPEAGMRRALPSPHPELLWDWAARTLWRMQSRCLRPIRVRRAGRAWMPTPSTSCGTWSFSINCPLQRRRPSGPLPSRFSSCYAL